MSEILDRYRRNADTFTDLVRRVPDDAWSRPTPCEGWDARTLVNHIVETSGMFLGFIGIEAKQTVHVDDDPAAALAEARSQVEDALANPELATKEYTSPFGTSVFEQSADQFLSADLTIHGWDLATGVGLPLELEQDEVAKLHAGLAAAEERFGPAFRSSGTFGPAIEPPPDADATERLLAFLGRDPRWSG
jgi:uncharacterized protein (TIGR03086 family)